MNTKTVPHDAADFLTDEATIAAYLSEALETGDARIIAKALGTIARARGMTRVSNDTGLSREALYRALSETGNPEFGTILKVIHALGLRLSVAPLPAVLA